ncbi:MAG: ribonuclease PH [Alphaproteobacteria bacterium]|nr:ribonuclease PH [Alphaproteobacteria bacterium]
MLRQHRKKNELRQIEIIKNVNLYAEGSCLIKCGNTHVLCTATVDSKVPDWLKDSDKGWVTAEYSLLPRSTPTRIVREKNLNAGRTQEIKRLIGRSLRAVVDLKKLKNFQIIVDCDVLQADGGTRTASITGGFVALYLACQKLVASGQLPRMPINEFVAAVSCGIHDGQALLDLDYEEDGTADTDSNFVLTESGQIVEIQATAEGEPFDEQAFHELLGLAREGISELIDIQKKAIRG